MLYRLLLNFLTYKSIKNEEKNDFFSFHVYVTLITSNTKLIFLFYFSNSPYLELLEILSKGLTLFFIIPMPNCHFEKKKSLQIATFFYLNFRLCLIYFLKILFSLNFACGSFIKIKMKFTCFNKYLKKLLFLQFKFETVKIYFFVLLKKIKTLKSF